MTVEQVRDRLPGRPMGTTGMNDLGRLHDQGLARRDLVSGLGPLTIDTYLPALPAITRDLQTGAAAVQLTLTGTLAGLALGQVVIGPISDAVGRRAPLLAGTGLHVVASLLCAVAPN